MSKFNVLTTEFTDIKSKEVSNGAMLCVNSRMQFDFILSEGLAALIPGYTPLVFILMNDEHKVAASGVIVIKSSGIPETDCRTVIKAFEPLLDSKLTDVLIAVPTYGHKEVRSLEGTVVTVLAPYTFAYLDPSNYLEGTFDTKTEVDVDYVPTDNDVQVLAYDLEYTREILSAGDVAEQDAAIPIDNLAWAFKTSLDAFVFNKTCEDVSRGNSQLTLVESPGTLQ